MSMHQNSIESHQGKNRGRKSMTSSIANRSLTRAEARRSKKSVPFLQRFWAWMWMSQRNPEDEEEVEKEGMEENGIKSNDFVESITIAMLQAHTQKVFSLCERIQQQRQRKLHDVKGVNSDDKTNTVGKETVQVKISCALKNILRKEQKSHRSDEESSPPNAFQLLRRLKHLIVLLESTLDRLLTEEAKESMQTVELILHHSNHQQEDVKDASRQWREKRFHHDNCSSWTSMASLVVPFLKAHTIYHFSKVCKAWRKISYKEMTTRFIREPRKSSTGGCSKAKWMLYVLQGCKCSRTNQLEEEEEEDEEKFQKTNKCTKNDSSTHAVAKEQKLVLQIQADCRRSFTDERQRRLGLSCIRLTDEGRLAHTLGMYAALDPEIGYVQGMNYVALVCHRIAAMPTWEEEQDKQEKQEERVEERIEERIEERVEERIEEEVEERIEEEVDKEVEEQDKERSISTPTSLPSDIENVPELQESSKPLLSETKKGRSEQTVMERKAKEKMNDTTHSTQAWTLFVGLMQKGKFRWLYLDGLKGVRLLLYQLTRIVQLYHGDLFDHLHSLGMHDCTAIATSWLISVFCDCNIFSIAIVENILFQLVQRSTDQPRQSKYLLKCCVLILKELSPRLLSMNDRRDFFRFLQDTQQVQGSSRVLVDVSLFQENIRNLRLSNAMLSLFFDEFHAVFVASSFTKKEAS